MSTELKNLHLDKGKGKLSERMQQALYKLGYAVLAFRGFHGKLYPCA